MAGNFIRPAKHYCGEGRFGTWTDWTSAQSQALKKAPFPTLVIKLIQGFTSCKTLAIIVSPSYGAGNWCEQACFL